MSRERKYDYNISLKWFGLDSSYTFIYCGHKTNVTGSSKGAWSPDISSESFFNARTVSEWTDVLLVKNSRKWWPAVILVCRQRFLLTRAQDRLGTSRRHGGVIITAVPWGDEGLFKARMFVLFTAIIGCATFDDSTRKPTSEWVSSWFKQSLFAFMKILTIKIIVWALNKPGLWMLTNIIY